MSTIAEYLESLRGKSIAVIGMGVSNTLKGLQRLACQGLQ